MSATNRGAVRDPLDFYGTPTWATEAILVKLLSQPGAEKLRSVLEPCAGTGAIARVLRDIGYSPWCLELDEERAQRCMSAGFGTTVGDFLLDGPQDEHDWDLVLTNPPFSLALEFVQKSLTLAECVVMLLPLNFMSSKTRVEFNTRNPAHLHVLPKRPSFGLNKHGKPGTDAQDYGWFQWGGPGYKPGHWEPI